VFLGRWFEDRRVRPAGEGQERALGGVFRKACGDGRDRGGLFQYQFDGQTDQVAVSASPRWASVLVIDSGRNGIMLVFQLVERWHVA